MAVDDRLWRGSRERIAPAQGDQSSAFLSPGLWLWATRNTPLLNLHLLAGRVCLLPPSPCSQEEAECGRSPKKVRIDFENC